MSTEHPTEGRWYCVDKHGMATLCADEADAIFEAASNDGNYSRNAPHTACQLVPVERELLVAVAQAVEFAEYVVGAAKGSMVERAKHFLSMPYAQELARRLKA